MDLPTAAPVVLKLKIHFRGSSTTLLLRHTDSPSATTGCLCVLTTHTDPPLMAQTSVSPDFFELQKNFRS